MLTEHQLLRARVGGDGVEVGREAQRRRDREPARQALVVGRERHVGAERPAREQERFVAHERVRARVERRLHVEELAATVVVRARAPLDAPEVEPQRGDAGRREGVEQRADHDRAHGAAVLRVGMAQHRQPRAGARPASRARPPGPTPSAVVSVSERVGIAP